MWAAGSAVAALLAALLCSPALSRNLQQEPVAEWANRFVAASDPILSGELLADYICAAQGMSLSPFDETTLFYTCKDPGSRPLLPMQVEVASHISLNGMKLPPLDTGILWIRAKGCPNSYVFPPEPCDPGQSGWFIHAVNSNCTYCGDNNEFGIDTTGPCIACTPPNRDAYATTPFFVRDDATLRIDGMSIAGARTRTRGGAMTAWKSSFVMLNYVYFYNNKAELDAGAIQVGQDAELQMFGVEFDENYIFPSDRVFSVVRNDIWIADGGVVRGVSDDMRVEGCTACSSSFMPPSPPSPPPSSPPPPPSPPPLPPSPPPPLPPGIMEPEEEEVLDDGIDPDTLLFEARLRKTLKRNSDNQILVLTVGVGGGAFVVCSVMLCVIWFLLIRVRTLNTRIGEAIAMYRRSQKEKHRAQMVERYGRTNMPATYTMSGLQKRMVYDSMKARLEGRRNPDDDDDDVQPHVYQDVDEEEAIEAALQEKKKAKKEKRKKKNKGERLDDSVSEVSSVPSKVVPCDDGPHPKKKKKESKSMKFTTTGEPLTVPKKPPGDIPVRPTRAWHLEPVDKVGMSLPQPAAGEAHTDTDDRGGSNKRGWNIFGALHSKSGLK